MELPLCKRLTKTKPQDRACRKIAALSRIRGIGGNFAAVLTREVFYRSFDNRRQIASYVGINPGGDNRRRIDRQELPPAAFTGGDTGNATVFFFGGTTPPRFRWVASRRGSPRA